MLLAARQLCEILFELIPHLQGGNDVCLARLCDVHISLKMHIVSNWQRKIDGCAHKTSTPPEVIKY